MSEDPRLVIVYLILANIIRPVKTPKILYSGSFIYLQLICTDGNLHNELYDNTRS